MVTLVLILGVLFLLVCIYQLNQLKVSERTSEMQKRWISVIMGLFALPILKLLDRILLDFGMKSEFAFYMSILVLLIMAFAIKWLTSMRLKTSN